MVGTEQFPLKPTYIINNYYTHSKLMKKGYNSAVEPQVGIQMLQQQWKAQKRKQYTESSAKSTAEEVKAYEQIEKDSFDVFKNVTILAGTVFATSIALASGKSVNTIFVVGEFFLLLATICGGILTWNQIESKQWLHFLNVSGRLKMDLIQYKEVMEGFIEKTTREMVESYEKMMKRKTLLNYLFKIIKVDWFPTITFIFFFLGLILVWTSLFMPQPSLPQSPPIPPTIR